ncbi:MAG: ATP-binding protein [Bradymonadia bacterium]
MEELLSYIEEHAQDLVTDLVTSLREIDADFHEADPGVLAHNLVQAVRHFLVFARGRDGAHLDAAFRLLQAPWPDRPLPISRAVRVLFGLEDLVAIRAQHRFTDQEFFIDALRAVRVAIREALCLLGDQVQRGGITRPTQRRAPRHTQRQVAGGRRPQPHEIARWLTRLGGHRFVGRSQALQTLWERFRAAAEGTGHEVVGVRGPQGSGRTRMLASFSERVERLLGRPPCYLKAQGHHLFSLPHWPFVQLLKQFFGIGLGDEALGEKVDHGVRSLAEFAAEDADDGLGRETLLDRITDIQAFLGDSGARRMLEGTDPRTAGVRLREGLVAAFKAIAAQAVALTGAPLFLEIEDAEELDAASWLMLNQLLDGLRSRTRMLVILTYGEQYRVPPAIRQTRGYTELQLKPFDPAESEAQIDGLLQPNRLSEQDRLRILSAAVGSPLMVAELVRHLISLGHLVMEGDVWVTLGPIPEEALARDVASVVSRRLEALDASATPVLEAVTVVQDALGAGILEEVIARRGIDRHEMTAAVDTLERSGLVESGDGIRITHPLIRDEIYRQMHPERRRAIHEDAGEVYMRLPLHEANPALAASHFALAGVPGRAVSGLIDGVHQALRVHDLAGALGLCHQATGLLKGLPTPDQDRQLFRILRLREHIHGLTGAREAQGRDLHQLEILAPRVATEDERLQLAGRRARFALLTGSHAQVESLVLSVISSQPAGRPGWVRGRLLLALDFWQQGDQTRALQWLEEAQEAMGADLPVSLRSRLAHTRGAFALAAGDAEKALDALNEAIAMHQDAGDVYGEGVATFHLGILCWSEGHLIAAVRLFRRAWLMVRNSEERATIAWMMVTAGNLHTALGDYEAALRYVEPLLRDATFDTERAQQAEATILRGRILVNQGRYDEAMRVIGQCLKNLARAGKRQPLYVDGLNALGLALVAANRGEKLVHGALRYAADALEKSAELDYSQGRVEALGVQVRGHLILDQHPEARQRLKQMEDAFESARSGQPALSRLVVEVSWCRLLVAEAMGDGAGAEDALGAAWRDLLWQAQCLKGTGFERPFLRNVALHRGVVDRVVAEGA